MFKFWSAAAVILIAAAPAATRAQVGFYFGGDYGGAAPYFDNQGEDAEIGQLLGVHLGYNFDDRWGVSLQWSAAWGGVDGEELGRDLEWAEQCLALSGRYSHPLTPGFRVFGEAGVAQYQAALVSEDSRLTAGPVLGARAAVGLLFHHKHYYLGPEISWHFARYDDSELETDVYLPGYGPADDYDVDGLGSGGMLTFSLKAGYHFGP